VELKSAMGRMDGFFSLKRGFFCSIDRKFLAKKVNSFISKNIFFLTLEEFIF